MPSSLFQPARRRANSGIWCPRAGESSNQGFGRFLPRLSDLLDSNSQGSLQFGVNARCIWYKVPAETTEANSKKEREAEMEESELTKQEERRKRRESGEGEREIRGRGGGERRSESMQEKTQKREKQKQNEKEEERKDWGKRGNNGIGRGWEKRKDRKTEPKDRGEERKEGKAGRTPKKKAKEKKKPQNQKKVSGLKCTGFLPASWKDSEESLSCGANHLHPVFVLCAHPSCYRELHSLLQSER